MSTLNNLIATLREEIINPVVDLFMPRLCSACGEELGRGQHYICTSCRLDIPLTQFWLERENPMVERVRALRPEIEHASALIFFIQSSQWREIIHRLKYQSEYRHALLFGRWLGVELRQSPLYNSVDCVVAVPLHPLRHIWRGYNQADYLANGVAKSMGVKHIRGAIRRTRHNKPQASMPRDNRWDNANELFEVTHPEALEGRTILLVDDVFTTGATILSCAETILDTIPNCTILISTLAVSNKEFGYVK